jgi:hypothetical protein
MMLLYDTNSLGLSTHRGDCRIWMRRARHLSLRVDLDASDAPNRRLGDTGRRVIIWPSAPRVRADMSAWPGRDGRRSVRVISDAPDWAGVRGLSG